jgi:hypothetical protein
MILGLVKLMRRLGYAGQRTGSQLSLQTHSSIGSGLASTEAGCGRSWPSHLHFCKKHRGMGDLPVRVASPDCTMMYNIPEIRGRGEFGGYEVREQYLH